MTHLQIASELLGGRLKGRVWHSGLLWICSDLGKSETGFSSKRSSSEPSRASKYTSVNEKYTLSYEQEFIIAETLHPHCRFFPPKHPRSLGTPTCRAESICSKPANHFLSCLPKAKGLTAARQGCLEHCRGRGKAARDHGCCGRAKY